VDILTCRADTGRVMEYPGNGAGGLPPPRATVLVGCANYTAFRPSPTTTADGTPDLIVRDNNHR